MHKWEGNNNLLCQIKPLFGAKDHKFDARIFHHDAHTPQKTERRQKIEADQHWRGKGQAIRMECHIWMFGMNESKIGMDWIIFFEQIPFGPKNSKKKYLI